MFGTMLEGLETLWMRDSQIHFQFVIIKVMVLVSRGVHASASMDGLEGQLIALQELVHLAQHGLIKHMLMGTHIRV